MHIAQKICEETNRDFGAFFRFQFSMARQAPVGSGSWITRKIGLWSLCHCPDLPVCSISDANGSPIGLFLGVGVTAVGQVVEEASKLQAVVGDPDFWDKIETEIEGIAGRYVVVICANGDERIYFDPVLDLSVVYDPQDQVVASSLLLALRRPYQPNKLFDDDMIRRDGCSVGLQNTRDATVRRALPNHYLDLRDFALHRHWPRGNECFDTAADQVPEETVRISNRLGQVFGALVNAFDCVVPITGGYDSRNLIAAGSEHLDRVKSFFTHRTNGISSFDCLLAEKIAAELGLPHQVIDVFSTESSERYTAFEKRRLRQDFFFRVGYEATQSLNIAVAVDSAPKGQLLLRGNVMDMMGANQYTKNHREGAFDLTHGLNKLHLTPREADSPAAKWGESYCAWMDTLPENTQNRTYDFAFIEQLLPNTLGARQNGYVRNFYVNPFSDRRLITRALSISPAYRRQGALNNDILSHAGPNLMQIPFLKTARFDPLFVEEVAARYRPAR